MRHARHAGRGLPYRNFYPSEAAVVQVDRRADVLGRRTRLDLPIVGGVAETIRALLPRVHKKTGRVFLENARRHYADARQGLDDLARPSTHRNIIHPQYLTRVSDQLAARDAIFTADVGTPTVWAARYLTMNGQRRLLESADSPC